MSHDAGGRIIDMNDRQDSLTGGAMSQGQQPSQEVIDLAELMARLWSRRWLILICAALGLVVAVYQIHRSTFIYTAELKVSPAQSSESGRGGALGGMAGLAARAGLSLGQSAGSSSFSLYKEGLATRSLAAALAERPDIMHVVFAGEWDAAQGKYVEPRRGLVGRTAQGVKSILGYPKHEWVAPNAARMQDYLKGAIKVVDNPETGVTTLTYGHPDPAFAARFLMEVHYIADRNLRLKARRRATQYIEYLSGQLRTISLVEHRTAIADALSEQEKARMTASSTLAFAAEPVDVATPTLRPTTPAPTLMLVFGVIGGFAVGLIGALITTLAPVRRYLARDRAT
ncbi:Wzz/FepE/Etk N-terminal domain-containing protein [Sphingoaurantiacus capsulatus]|uniref:Wzz/FepE/Etk N-terminal domain-containing protein n=1 Tax=Sphingoaurantiacus capsulatus TaxID=1771310 RepID=A0ABV7XAU6_9SPHN